MLGVIIVVMTTTAATTAHARIMESRILMQQPHMDRTGLALGCVEG